MKPVSGKAGREDSPRIDRASVCQGLAAGLAGTAALTLFERLEQVLLGRAQIYHPNRIAGRLLGWAASESRVKRTGLLLRWTYGPLLGVLYVAARRNFPNSTLAAGLWCGLGIYAFESVAMPSLGATPPLRRWPAAEVVLLSLHTTAFGLTTAATAEFLKRVTLSDPSPPNARALEGDP